MNVVKKLEKFFSIKLMQDIEEGRIEKKIDKKKITIGDIVEVS
jgi:ribosome-binding protein aMBF1 (putative translation factor)